MGIVTRRAVTNIIAVSSAVASSICLCNYANTPDLAEETKVVQIASSILEGYQGSNPTEAVKHSKMILSTIPEYSGIRNKEFSDLERNLDVLNNQLAQVNSPEVYGPAMREIGIKLNRLAEHNKKPKNALYSGLMFGLAVLVSAAYSSLSDEDLVE